MGCLNVVTIPLFIFLFFQGSQQRSLSSGVNVTVTGCPGTQCQCPDGFERQGESCYHAFSLEASWIEAKLFCRTLGADLVRIDSANEETVVEGIISRHAAVLSDAEFWTAGSDIIVEGQWRWMAEDGVSYMVSGYTNWGQGKPDSNVAEADCMMLHYRHVNRHTYWDDDRCSNHHSFVCETMY